MDSETFARKISALKTLLESFDIPDMRRELRLSDIRWLSRNLSIKNKDNPMLETTMGLIKWLLKNYSHINNDSSSFPIKEMGKLYKYKADYIIKLK